MSGLDARGDCRSYTKEKHAISTAAGHALLPRLTILQDSVCHLALNLSLRISTSQQLQQVLVLRHPIHRPDNENRFGRVRLLWKIISGEGECCHCRLIEVQGEISRGSGAIYPMETTMRFEVRAHRPSRSHDQLRTRV